MLEGQRVPVAYDIYPMDDPIGGARLVRLTEDECAKGTKYRKVLRGTGEGLIILHADHAAITAGYFVEGNYVRVVECHPDFSEKVIGGFWLKAGGEVVVSRKEAGGEYRQLGGPGTIDLFNRSTFPYILRSLGDANLDAHNEFLTANGYLRFNGPETYGGIMRRVFLEAQLDVPSALPGDLPDPDWDDVNDSNGNPWTVFDDYYDVRMGDNVLDIFLDLMRKGIDLIIDPDTFEAHAYLAGDYGTDRTSATFATNKVRFQRAVNIRSDLDKAIHQLPYASHVLAIGEDGKTRVLRNDPDWSSGDLVVRDTIHVAGTNDGDILAEAALESIRLRKLATSEARFPIVSGNSQTEGLYLAGRHFDVGDLVTLHTGTGAHEYDEQPIQVAAITWEIVSGRGHEATVELGAQYIDANTAREIRSLTTLIRDSGGLKLCTALIPGSETSHRLYFLNTTATARSVAAGWDDSSDMVARQMSFTPGGAADSFASWDAVNQAAAEFALLQGQITLSNAGLLAAVQSGGTFRIQARIGIRHGIGIDESSAREYLEGSIRVYRPGTSSFIGTALSVGGATGTVYANTDPSGTLGNRSMFGTLAAVPGAVSTDVLVVELGLKHTAPTGGGAGGSVWWNDTAASDLPEDDSTTTNLRSWVELRTVTAPTGSGLHPDLVGTETQAARCDHRHLIISDRQPTTDDNIDNGYPIATLWTDTDSGNTYVLTDQDAGTWVLIAAGTELPIDVSDIVGLAAVVIPIADAGGYYTGTEVEAALQEIGADIAILEAADVALAAADAALDSRLDALEAATGHYEVLMDGSTPPNPMEDGSGYDWLYVWVS